MDRILSPRHVRSSQRPTPSADRTTLPPAARATIPATNPAAVPTGDPAAPALPREAWVDWQGGTSASWGKSHGEGTTDSPSGHEAPRDMPVSLFELRVQSVQGRQAPLMAAASPASPAEAACAPSATLAPLPFPALATETDYARLVVQQTEQGAISLADIARPGIAVFDAENDKWTVLQGAGRLEKARPNDWLDLFVESGTPIPKGTIYAERGVAADLVRDANLLSSRGVNGTNPELVGVLTQGKVFDRVFVPRHDAEAPTSKILHENKQGYRTLIEQLGGVEPADQVLAQHDFQNRSAVEQRRILQDLGVVPADDE